MVVDETPIFYLVMNRMAIDNVTCADFLTPVAFWMGYILVMEAHSILIRVSHPGLIVNERDPYSETDDTIPAPSSLSHA